MFMSCFLQSMIYTYKRSGFTYLIRIVFVTLDDLSRKKREKTVLSAAA
jgi:hypothetical protein